MLDTVRAYESTENHIKATEASDVNIIDRKFTKCKYCGSHHKRGQCPAYGKHVEHAIDRIILLWYAKAR